MHEPACISLVPRRYCKRSKTGAGEGLGTRLTCIPREVKSNDFSCSERHLSRCWCVCWPKNASSNWRTGLLLEPSLMLCVPVLCRRLTSVYAKFIASFPGLPTVQFLIACSMQNGGGRPGPFYHVNDVLSTRGRQRGGGVPNGFRPYLVVSATSTGITPDLNIREVKNIPLLFQNEECVCEMRSFDQGGPLPPSVYLGRHWRHSHEKMDQAFPLCFLHTASDQKLDGGKAWERGCQIYIWS